MTGRERILATIEGRETDHLALMPITMMFAARQIGVPYREYATDYRVLAEAQVRTAAAFGFDYVSTISDPAREAADLGAAIEWFPDQPPAIVESRAFARFAATPAAIARNNSTDGCVGEGLCSHFCCG